MYLRFLAVNETTKNGFPSCGFTTNYLKATHPAIKKLIKTPKLFWSHGKFFTSVSLSERKNSA